MIFAQALPTSDGQEGLVFGEEVPLRKSRGIRLRRSNGPPYSRRGYRDWKCKMVSKDTGAAANPRRIAGVCLSCPLSEKL
jgi:hypothetical protein